MPEGQTDRPIRKLGVYMQEPSSAQSDRQETWERLYFRQTALDLQTVKAQGGESQRASLPLRSDTGMCYKHRSSTTFQSCPICWDPSIYPDICNNDDERVPLCALTIKRTVCSGHCSSSPLKPFSPEDLSPGQKCRST